MYLQVQVSIGDEELEQTLEAKNTGDKPFELTAALHTYIAVSSIDKVGQWSSSAHYRSILGQLSWRLLRQLKAAKPSFPRKYMLDLQACDSGWILSACMHFTSPGMIRNLPLCRRMWWASRVWSIWTACRIRSG